MSAKNSVKVYIPQGFYHIYNRGVEKRNIFLDEEDYRVFLSYLKIYLSPKEIILEEIKREKNLGFDQIMEKISQLQRMKNFVGRIKLISFCLMPNHFHFLLRQEEADDMKFFMKSLSVKYAQYFNKKYHRVGHLFQGRYRAVLVDGEEYFLHLSRYIHLNPRNILDKGQKLADYPWSSYPFYLGKGQASWLDKKLLTAHFSGLKGLGFNSYQRFVEEYKEAMEVEEKAYQNLLLD